MWLLRLLETTTLQYILSMKILTGVFFALAAIDGTYHLTGTPCQYHVIVGEYKWGRVPIWCFIYPTK